MVQSYSRAVGTLPMARWTEVDKAACILVVQHTLQTAGAHAMGGQAHAMESLQRGFPRHPVWRTAYPAFWGWFDPPEHGAYLRF